MNHAAIVRRGESRAELARRLHGFIAGQASDAQEQGSEILAVHVLHGDERHPFDLADIVNPADVGCETRRATRTSPWKRSSRR